jgi:serine phosphatase RsbU (regulator of sigma subunit)/anti-sigma regulatory factor (Ser/Thr protein kinase)
VVTTEDTANVNRAELPEDGVQVVFPIDAAPGAVARARRFVAQQFAEHGLTELADDAQLVVGELATNALLYAGPPAQLVLQFMPPRARLEVRDRNPMPPVRSRPNDETMTGRGLHLVEALTRGWGVDSHSSGKVVWAEFEAGTGGGADLDEATLIAMWAADEPDPASTAGDELHTVRLGDVPTDLLLSAKAHVDNLVREFMLAAAGARSGESAPVPAPIAALLETVVNRFADARQAIKRQALTAANAGEDHVRLELTLPVSAADAGEEYLRALDEADAYCRAARLLTLESSPQHRVFRHWYVDELVDQLRRAAAGEPPVPAQTFTRRLLHEIDMVASAERQSERAARLHALTVALSAAATPEAVASAVLREGVAALGAAGGGVLLVTDGPTLSVPGTVGYDESTVAQLRAESPNAELPAAAAVRTGEAVWLESRAERDERFRGLLGLEPATVSMCAVPLIVDGRTLGALRFSFNETRLFDAEERSFVEALAAQTAQALDRAQLYERRIDVARRLQRSLLPPQLPDIPGIGVRAVYHPVTAAMEVGGDFYDVWPCGPQRWAVAIGDVGGTGPEAAAVTALVRHTLRALTMSSTDIPAILEQLNRAVADAALDDHNERFCTVLFGILRMEPERVWLELGSGGHLGPVIVRADGSVGVIEFTGSLLGVLPEVTIDLRRIELSPGDEIVVVTDGVTEARRGSDRFGIEGVAEVAAASRGQGIDTAAAVQQAVHRFAAGDTHDDLVVLTIRRGTTAPEA